MPRSASQPRRRNPRQSRSQATCDAILTATARVLVKDGYDAASTNRIAKEAGVSIGSLYQYFPSKEGLVVAVMERHRTQSLAEFEAGLTQLASQPLPVALRALIGQVIASKVDNPRLHQVLHELLPRLREWGTVDTFEQRLIRMVRAFLLPRAHDIRPANLDMAVFIMVHTVDALCHAAVSQRPDYLEDDTFAEELCALVLGYLRPEATSTPRRRGRSEPRRLSPARRQERAAPAR
ncbi:TetR/AcrR family transcriptional regulator [Corallococcus sp. M34]|uniref:TetR/AcrR family transcriptional regulator n=1 Tax=Citreicoccus inhibens TaxID=2849499 RepID=UPI001C210C5F|nr:TetR/AcrR family transcriptional regulator [Citreicoccus inhibens]MBU8896711.1 TetR/AcrR family transcriptional regulator [Citreicoccus inhibens]